VSFSGRSVAKRGWLLLKGVVAPLAIAAALVPGAGAFAAQVVELAQFQAPAPVVQVPNFQIPAPAPPPPRTASPTAILEAHPPRPAPPPACGEWLASIGIRCDTNSQLKALGGAGAAIIVAILTVGWRLLMRWSRSVEHRDSWPSEEEANKVLESDGDQRPR